MKLLQECLDELKREFKKFNSIDQKSLCDKILILENALLKSFRAKLKEHVGAAEFNFIGFKTKALLKNIDEIKQLLNTLLNRCCVQFYVQYKNTRNGSDDQSDQTFSIFKFCDQETHALIQEIYELAKSRVYILRERDISEQEYMKSGENAEDIRKTKRKFCSIEKEYGIPYHQYLVKWNWWRDKVFERVKGINKFEVMYDIEVNYE